MKWSFVWDKECLNLKRTTIEPLVLMGECVTIRALLFKVNPQCEFIPGKGLIKQLSEQPVHCQGGSLCLSDARVAPEFDDHLMQVLPSNWLINQQICLGLADCVARFSIGERRHDDDRDMFKTRQPPYPLADFNAAGKRHVDIQDHEVWGIVLQIGQCLMTILHGDDLVIMSREHELEYLAVTVAIVSDENGLGALHPIIVVKKL
jgi:hypothetical protein